MPDANEIVYGIAEGVSDGKLAVKTPEGSVMELDFDYLICATGISAPTFTPIPGQDSTNRREEIENLRKVICDPTKHIVIAGGGATGVEIAGSILDSGNKNITLITPGDRLLPDLAKTYADKALYHLESRGVRVLFGSRASDPLETTIATSGAPLSVSLIGGKTIECDVYLPAYSRGPRTGWLDQPNGDAKLPGGLLDQRGRVEVDEYLASKIYPKVYVIGACNNYPEPALGANFDSQAQCIVKNLIKEKSAIYPGGAVKLPLVQMIGHRTYGFFIPEALNVPKPMRWCLCTACGFPINLLCPFVWCGILCGPCNPMTCGYCCSDPEGKGVSQTFAAASKMGLAASTYGFVGLAKVGSEEMSR